MNVAQKKPSGRPRKDAARHDADREALVSAAFAILREGGSSALTARGVAARVGTAVGSVYTAFESLEALRLEANAVTMGLLRACLAEALARCQEGATEARLLCLARAYMGFASQHRRLWLALFEPRRLAAPPAVAAHISGLFALLEEVLAGSGGPQARDVPLLARALWSSVHGTVYLAEIGSLGPIGRDDAPAMVEALIRAVVGGLRSGVPPAEPV